jgi:pyruvate dehydrogenase E2 component (dihydrolipoamide acetyltransferase)
MARELGVVLERIKGSGPGGRIVKEDVQRASEAGVPAEAPKPQAQPKPAKPAAAAEVTSSKGEITTQELTRTQQLIARRMAESKATVPDFALSLEVEMDGAVDLRSKLKRVASEGEVVPSFNDMVVKAVALALREYPRVNGSYKDGRFELHQRINVGVAVATEDALIVPTVFDANQKSLGEIAANTRELAAHVRDGSITPPQLSGGTFTVSNLGMYGITNFTAVINPPQAAILTVGAITPKAVVREGSIVARQMMGVTLVCDHRILYGADAAQFLGRMRELLEQPVALTV